MLKTDSARGRRVGIALVTLTTLCFSILDASAKWLVQGLPVLEVVWLRFATHVLLMALVLSPVYGASLWRMQSPRLHLLRGLMLASMTALNFWALQYLQLAVTAALQAVVVVISGSVALLADTVHNLSDALTALPLWVAFVLVRRPPSKRYTFGLGRVEALAGLVIVVMIALSAVVAAWESIRRIADPQPVTHLGAVVAAGLIGFAGNEAVAVYRTRVGRRIGSAALVADGQHARTDGWTSLGVVAGAIGVALGFPLADPIVGLLITVAIAGVLVGAVRDVGRRLLDGVDPALPEQAEQVLAGVAGVESVDDVRLRWIGHRLRGEAVIGVAPHLDVVTAHDVATRAAAAVHAAMPNLDAVTVHVEPAGADRAESHSAPVGTHAPGR